MLLEILIAILLGVAAGTITGLSPSIHINLIASLLLASPSFFSFFSPMALAIFVVSMAITHTFLDFIPSILLGAPEEDTFLSLLPGHLLLKKGRGYEAIILTLYGSLFSLAIILIFTPLFIYFLPLVFLTLKKILPFVLIFVSLYGLLREPAPILALVVFLSSGFLGFLSFNLPIKEPLMPLLTGFFGVSSILLSLSQKQNIPPQKIIPLKKIKLSKKEFFRASIISLVAPFCSFLPGISTGHAAFISSEILPQKKRGFLFLTGAANTIIMALGFVTLYSIGKTRSGSAAAVQEILKRISFNHLIIIMGVIFIVSIISFFLGVYLTKKIIPLINIIDYKKLSISVLFILLFFNLVFSNILGFVVLITATLIGIFCIASNLKRINLMGALILPVVLFYLQNN